MHKIGSTYNNRGPSEVPGSTDPRERTSMVTDNLLRKTLQKRSQHFSKDLEKVRVRSGEAALAGAERCAQRKRGATV